MQTGDLAGFVLAGGKSSRMGQNKALLELGGIALIDRALSLLSPLCGAITIVGPRLLPQVASVPDRYPERGPLGGMETALAQLTNDWALFLPVDMPFLPRGLFGGLVGRWLSQVHSGCRIAYPVVDGIAQPLVAMVHRSALPSLRSSLAEGNNKVVPALEAAADAIAGTLGVDASHVLERTEIETGGMIPGFLNWSPGPFEVLTRASWFTNLNTPGSFQRAEELLCSATRAAEVAGSP